MSTTDDPRDPELTHGPDEGPAPQAKKYLVLSEAERARGFVRPVRQCYIHDACGGETRMSWSIAETYARQPSFYGSTYCVHCSMHLPVGEFTWSGTDERVGS